MQVHCYFTATIKKKNNQSPTAAKQAPAKRAPTPAKKAPAKAPARAPAKALTKAPVKGKASQKRAQVSDASELPEEGVSNESMVQFDANIEPEKIHTLIPEAYRTTANDGSYVFNLGTQRSTFYNQIDSEVHYDEKNGLWRTDGTNLAQTGEQDIASTRYVAENVYDFTRNYTAPWANFPRSEKPPTEA
jgi:hypothetical protein